MKKISLMIACFVLAIMFTSCHSAEKELISAVNEFNSECPVDLGMSGEITSLEYENSEVVMTVTFNKDMLVDLNAISDKTDMIKEMLMGLFATNGDDDVLFNAISEAGASFTIKIIDGNGGQLEVSLDKKDVEALKNGDVEPMKAEKYVEMLAIMGNAQCPVAVDETTLLKSISTEGKCLVYSYIVDENYVDIELLIMSEDEMKANLIEEFSCGDPSMDALADACSDAEYDLVYRYEGSLSGKVHTIRISWEEL